MIEKITDYSVRNPLIVIIVTALVSIWGVYCLERTPVDAIPDLSENQVIVFTDWMGRSPQEIEDQITYPLSVNLQGLAGVKAVRSTSEFNYSMINVIFDDKTDFYFARVRVLERLSIASTFLPPGVVPYLAPDATALGQIFWYTVESDSADLGELRALQDFYVRYQLNSVPGVAQVASVGGYVREYQVDLDPQKLRAYGVTLGEIYNAVARSNSSVGGNVFQKNNSEYLIRGVGWIRDVKDVENVVVASRGGVPVYVKTVATVQLGPQARRAVLEKDGREAVGGVVLMRYGENPLDVTQRIKEKIVQLSKGLPSGVRIVPFYDRTRLITEAMHTVTGTLKEAMITASLAVILVMHHLGGVLVICLTLPLATLVSLILMYYLGVPSNIMSLSGIAISIGVLVDSSIVMVDNATHELTRAFGKEKVRGDTTEIVAKACRLVGRPIFFSVAIMLISFLPVFALGGMEGKMFHPLAFTKSFALLGVAFLAITLVPALCPLLLRGRLTSEDENWIVRSFINIYKPLMQILMDKPRLVSWLFFIILGIGWNLSGKLGREFMPPLDEGSILDMPVTVPSASATQASDDLKQRDALLRAFPEVESVVGKAGRADTATDPSPLDMVETVVNLRPREHWTKRKLLFDDVTIVGRELLGVLQAKGFIKAGLKPEMQDSILNQAAMDATTSFDRIIRELVLRRQAEFQPRLAEALMRGLLEDLVAFLSSKRALKAAPAPSALNEISEHLARRHGEKLALQPLAVELTDAVDELVRQLAARGLVAPGPELLALEQGGVGAIVAQVKEAIGAPRQTLQTRLLAALERRRDEHWRDRIKTLNWELSDRAPAVLIWHLGEGLRDGARSAEALARDVTDADLRELATSLEGAYRNRFFLWTKTKADLVQEIDTEVRMPGWSNIWTQPIINRVDMLATGVRTMIGVKIFGDNLDQIQTVCNQVADVLRPIKGAVDVFPDQSVGENYLEIEIDRAKAARYGINVGDIQDVIDVALGGRTITMTVEGRRRFPVRVRYARDYREDEERIRRILVSTSVSAPGGMGAAAGMGAGMGASPAPSGSGSATAPLQIPLAQLAKVVVKPGPTMIKSENGMLRAYVQCNVRDRDIVGFVEEAQRAVDAKVKLPQGFYIEWSGQFEHQVRAKKTLQIVFPMVIVLIFVVLYVTFGSLGEALLVILAVPGALAGGVIFQYLFGFNFSVAVWVGYIACFGMATETGIVMVVYLREAIERHGGLANIASVEQLREIVLEGAVHRLRPKLLTEGTTIIGLMPMLWVTGTGAEVIRPMAAPVLGGILMADEAIDIFLPVLYAWMKAREWNRLRGDPGHEGGSGHNDGEHDHGKHPH
ncbi:MAG: efflux RND transporter permease subunit [Candidatus Wallbacteria bacterium]|nr:efflux RND transporter permease subunit [Candidatus Wallbacteria bacterium]